MKKWCVAALLGALALIPVMAWAQIGIDGLPPNRFHPFRGSNNCIQVVDSLGNFNCAPGTKVDPATGNLVIGGSITFGTGGASFAPGGLALTTNTNAQLLNAGDLVIATSPPTVLASGPLINGVTLRVRQGPGGTCQLVVAAGNGVQEFLIPVSPANLINPALSTQTSGGVVFTPSLPLLYSFSGGYLGC